MIGFGLNEGVLYSIGTSAKEHLQIKEKHEDYEVKADWVEFDQKRTFEPDAVDRIHVVHVWWHRWGRSR